MATTQDPADVVRAWIEAVNDGNTANADHRVADDVSIVGPRSVTSGRNVVAGWIRHTGIRLNTRDVTVQGGRVTVYAEATWLVEGGAPGERTPPATITMRFTVRDGLIALIERLDE